jgi:hypothetical protein
VRTDNAEDDDQVKQHVRAGAIAATAMLLGSMAPARAAASCKGVETASYDATSVGISYALDLVPCKAVKRAGTVTMRAWMTRTDVVTGARSTVTAVTVRCRPGAKTCKVRGRWPHPATEHARYDLYATYGTNGDVVLAGSVHDQRVCSTVASLHANCALPT